jgi:hypothetical protein
MLLWLMHISGSKLWASLMVAVSIFLMVQNVPALTNSVPFLTLWRLDKLSHVPRMRATGMSTK